LKYLIIVILFLSACSSPLSMGIKKERIKQTNNSELSTVPSLLGDRNFDIKSGGSVTINAQPTKLDPKTIKAMANLKTTLNASGASDSYSMSGTISAVVIGSLCVLILVIMLAFILARREISKWGFDPKTVGKVCHNVKSKLESHLEYVVNEKSKERTPDKVKDELERQRQYLKSLLNEF